MARGTLQTVLDHPSDENSHRQNQQSGSGRIHSLAKSSSAPEASEEAGAMKADASPRADSGDPATARESGSASPAASKDVSKPASRKKPIFIGIGALALMAQRRRRARRSTLRKPTSSRQKLISRARMR